MSRTNRLFINKAVDCVDEMLESIALQHPGLQLLLGHRVIIREDVSSFCGSGHVSIISGGGSGHEPFAAGFVGQGMLTAAVAGSIFASPPPLDILAAIEASKSSSGTLLIVANYTGDRLNFGIALERAKSRGHNIKMIVVGEDCALESNDKTAGRRGLVGIVNVMKIAGALSEQGKSLEQIVHVASSAAANMGTIGVSLSGCSIPGSGSSFELHASEMELGLGAHGEAGVKRMKIQLADDTVLTMINHMTNENNASRLTLTPGTQVAVTMNNLGGLSAVEMHVLARKVIMDLEKKDILVDRFYLGHLMTSLDMCGFNMNILKLTNVITSCLDADTNAPAWPKISVSTKSDHSRRNDHVMTFSLQSSKKSNACDSEGVLNVSESVLKCIEQTCNQLIAKESYLNELDTSCGDGDCGATLKRGASVVLSKLSSWKMITFPFLLLELASCAEMSMGGASGGIYSLFFTAASRYADSTTLVTFKNCIDSGMKSVMEYGKAEPGDRTMVDALVALSSSLETAIEKNLTISEAFAKAAKCVKEAAEKTASMQAKAGRASYVARALLKLPDPGAMAVAIIVQSIADHVNS